MGGWLHQPIVVEGGVEGRWMDFPGEAGQNSGLPPAAQLPHVPPDAVFRELFVGSWRVQKNSKAGLAMAPL